MRGYPFLLPLREKVASAARRMRGRWRSGPPPWLLRSLSLPLKGGGLALLAACTPDAPPPALPPPPTALAPTSGAIWRGDAYAALTEDPRARRVGDILTVRLVERTQASKTASLSTSRTSETALTLPDAEPFSRIPQGLTRGGADQSFAGDGAAAQSNRLDGEISVRVVAVEGGALRIAGVKRIGLNRGDETVELTGLVRPEDIEPGNRIASTRIADARIAYRGSGDVAAASRQGWFARLLGALSPF